MYSNNNLFSIWATLRTASAIYNWLAKDITPLNIDGFHIENVSLIKTERMFNRIIKPGPPHQTDVVAALHHHAVFNVKLLLHLKNSKEQAA